MMGDQLHLDVVRQYPECSDMYYRRLFIPWMEGQDPFGIPLTDMQVADFNFQVREWAMHLHEEYPDDSLGHASQKETKTELKAMEREWKTTPCITAEQKDDKAFDLLAWSRHRYVLIRRIFDLDIKADFYSLYLNGKELRFDYESAMHIMTRHFAHGMKPYNSTKDHVYGVFAYNELHKDFERIFQAIDASKTYVNDDVKEITFRYRGEIYRIYASVVDANNQTYRIDTFFPVSSPKILDELNEAFTEIPINDTLSIFSKHAGR